jgi:phosphopantetheine--protein transferase-like protein
MAVKIGIDILRNKRLKYAAENPEFFKKVFTPAELRYKSKIATIFALKEAVMKALGRKVEWKDIQIIYKKGKSQPSIFLSPNIEPKNLKSLASSASHDEDYTVAVVIFELE